MTGAIGAQSSIQIFAFGGAVSLYFRPVRVQVPRSPSSCWSSGSRTAKSLGLEDDLSKTALITGITGQDGAYLAELLLDKGYGVHGVKRRASSFNTDRIDHLYQDPHERDVRLKLHYGGLTDSADLVPTIQAVQPEESYNLAAQS